MRSAIICIYLLLQLIISLGISGCKKDNSLESSLINQEKLQKAAKYAAFNLSFANRVKGVYKLSLSSTQAFDANYWGWEYPTVFLENSNKTLSTYITLDNPFPQQFKEHTSNITLDSPFPQGNNAYSPNFPFADGSFPTSQSYTGIIRPIRIDTISRNKYDASGDPTTDNAPVTYLVSYDDYTADLTKFVITTKNASGNQVAKNTYSFEKDPRSYSTYYASRYVKESGTDTRVGSVSIKIESDSTSDSQKETYTYESYNANLILGNFDASGDLGPLSINTFDSIGGKTVVKIVTTVTHYTDATVDVSADSIKIVTTRYSNATTPFYQEVFKYHYENWNLKKLKDFEYKTYDLSGENQTMTGLNRKWYTNGFKTLENVYPVTGGAAQLPDIIKTTRDSQGRKTSYLRKGSSGDTVYKEVYTFDTAGRTATIRSYEVDTSANLTCSDEQNEDYLYEIITNTSGLSLRKISELYYSCNGTTLNPDPSSRVSKTYNKLGQLLMTQNYSYVAGSFELTAQSSSEYNSSGAKTKDIDYSVISDVAISTTYKEYNYDSNLYRISTVNYDSSGGVTAVYYATTYKYK